MKNFKQNVKQKTYQLFIVVLFFAGMGIMTIIKSALGYDPAFGIYQIFLLNTTILAGLLAVIVGIWVTSGESGKVTRILGFWLGIYGTYLFSLWGRNYVWILDSILRGIFGIEAVAFTPIVSMMILIAIITKLAEIASKILLSLIRWDIKRVQKVHLSREVESVG